MPRRNRIDPWGDLHAVAARGLFTGNRGCVVDDAERVVRHHGSRVWIICRTEFRGWRWPLARPRRWTPLFFLDEAVALAAGHRPCATCRRADYLAYRDAVSHGLGVTLPLRAEALNRRLAAETLPRGRGLSRAADRLLWTAPLNELPDGTVLAGADGSAELVYGQHLLRFAFSGWEAPRPRPHGVRVDVLTPPTSVLALAQGYTAMLHASAMSAAC